MSEEKFSDVAGSFLKSLDLERQLTLQQEQHETQMRALLDHFLATVDSLQELETHCAELVAEGLKDVPCKTIELIIRRALNGLAELGITPMEPVGVPLDLNLHDVVSVREDPSVPTDTVVAEAVRGYWWNNRTLRRAKVVIAGPKSAVNNELHREQS